MKRQKDTPRLHWLDGDRQRLQSDAVRGMAAGSGLNLSEHEAGEVADKIRLNGMEDTAYSPETVLDHGIRCHRDISEKVVNPHRRLDPAYREKLRAFFIEKRGLSPEEADRECDAVEVRGRPTLRCMRDARTWLHKAKHALKEGRNFAEKARTAKDEDARKAASIQSEEEFGRAVSLAYYAGVECGELKARASFDEKFGSDEKPKQKGRFSKLRKVTFGEYRTLVATGQSPTNADLRDAVAQPANGVTYSDGYFSWTDARGRKKRTSDRRWENIVTAARKSITV